MRRQLRTRAFATVAALAVATGAVGCSDDGDEGGATTSTTVPAGPSTTSTTEVEVPVTPPRQSVIAHRGASAQAPELTFAAFDLAVDQDADVIEIDVQQTRDGEVVLLHDPVVDRVATGPDDACTGTIVELTLDQVKRCDLGSWFNEANPDLADPAFADERMPTLPELLDRYGTDVRYLIETKTLLADGLEEAVVADLEDAGFTADAPSSRLIVVQSFDVASVQAFRRLRPDLTAVRLLGAADPVDGAALDAIAEYADGIGPARALVDETLVAAAHERCLVVTPYTIDDPNDMAVLLDLGVDGVITNRPDLLRPLVDDRPEHDLPCPGD